MGRFYEIQRIKINESELINLPKGRESLKVIKVSGVEKYFPAYGSIVNSVKSQLDKERKKNIKPQDQYASAEVLLKAQRETLSLSKSGNDKNILRNNLMKLLDEESRRILNAFGGAEIHHIVELYDESAKESRNIFKKLKVGLNDPINGIFLPENNNEDNIFHGSIHSGKHSDEYSAFVYETIKNVSSVEELIVELDKIKEQLWTSSLPLNKK